MEIPYWDEGEIPKRILHPQSSVSYPGGYAGLLAVALSTHALIGYVLGYVGIVEPVPKRLDDLIIVPFAVRAFPAGILKCREGKKGLPLQRFGCDGISFTVEQQFFVDPRAKDFTQLLAG